MVDVFVNGVKFVNGTDFTATNGTTVVMAAALAAGNIVEIDNLLTAYLPTNALRTITTFTATAGQTTFSVSYTQGLIDVFYNGSNLAQSEYTATNGTSIILATACQLNDIVVVYAYSYSVGAYSGIGGSGTTNYVAKFSSSSAIANSLIYDNGTNVGIGTTTPSSILEIRETNRTNSSNVTNFGVYTTSSQGADVGGTIGLGGLFNGSSIAPFGSIRGGKENSTSGDYSGYLSFQTIPNNSNLVERMRITSGGKLCVQSTATIFANSANRINGVVNSGGEAALEVSNSGTTDGSPALSCYKANATTNSDARFIQFYASNGVTAMGGIVGNGASNVQFASISDIREKENIVSIDGSLNKILALNPVQFDWIKTSEHIKAGFIAQQVEEIFPEYVVSNMSNDGEEERKGLTGGLSSGIIAHIVKAIQEMNTKIIELEKIVATK
jgi:hypothetical protein